MIIYYTTVEKRQGYHTVQFSGYVRGHHAQYSTPKWYLQELCNKVALLRTRDLSLELTVQSREQL